MILPEVYLRVVSCFQIVAPNTAHIFGNDSADLACFHISYESFPSGTFKVSSAITIICVVATVGETVLLGIILQIDFLRRDLSRYVFAKECAIRIDKQQKERYNNVVIDNGIIIWAQRSDNMANKDPSLDDGIIQAAYSEFLAYGFQKASLHKIAEKAGVTTGAIYTRYKNKDALFASLLQDFFETMRTLFTPIAEEYEKAKCSAQPEDILCAINAEEQVYFRLLTEHRDDCTLFFCRSDGSSMETMLNELMDQKAEQTVEFFSHIYGKAPNADAIRLLMGSQFWYFRQLLDQHMEEGRMLICLQAVLDFTNAGWRQLCDTLQ